MRHPPIRTVAGNLKSVATARESCWVTALLQSADERGDGFRLAADLFARRGEGQREHDAEGETDGVATHDCQTVSPLHLDVKCEAGDDGFYALPAMPPPTGRRPSR